MSFRSSLSMKPSLFWSIMLKALGEVRDDASHKKCGNGIVLYLFEFLDLGLVEHGKDVGSGSLATLLGVLLLH